MYLNGFMMSDNQKGAPFYLRYTNIVAVKAVVLPVIGVHYIKIKASDHTYVIKVSRYFNNYVEMYSTMCERIFSAKPNANIDPKLLAYLDKKR